MIQWFGDRARSLIEARARMVGSKACKYMAKRGQFHAPVESGDLRDSIEVIPGGAKFTVHVGMDYALPVHNGHHAGSTWVPPNPFMLRAIEDTRRRWPSIVKEVTLESSFVREPTIDASGNLSYSTSGVGDLTVTF